MFELAAVYLGFALLAPALALLQRLAPESPAPPRVWARARRLDALYWLVSPLGTGVLTRVCTLAALGALAQATLGEPDPGRWLALVRERSPLPFARHPLALQLAEALLLADLVGYWSHRLRHTRALWPAHAVHHSAGSLDWLAAPRMHPLDDALDNVLIGLAVLHAGIDPRVFVALGPIFLLHTMLLHADLRWRFGPLRFVFASPAFHREHHALVQPRGGCNYAGLFAFYDVLFGTYFLPARRAPFERSFGAAGEPVPESLAGQLAYPLRRWYALVSALLDRAFAR